MNIKYSIPSTRTNVNETLKSELSEVYDLLTLNKFTLNIAKTKFTVLHPNLMPLNLITYTHAAPFLPISILITWRHKALIITTTTKSAENKHYENKIRRQHAAKLPTCLSKWDTVAHSPENNNSWYLWILVPRQNNTIWICIVFTAPSETVMYAISKRYPCVMLKSRRIITEKKCVIIFISGIN